MHGAEIAWKTSIIDLTCITDDKKRGGQDEEEPPVFAALNIYNICI